MDQDLALELGLLIVAQEPVLVGRTLLWDGPLSPPRHVGRGYMGETLQPMGGMHLLGEPEDVPHTLHVGSAQLLQWCVKPDIGSGVDNAIHSSYKAPMLALIQAQVLLGHVAGHRLDPPSQGRDQVRSVPPRSAQAMRCPTSIFSPHQHHDAMICVVQEPAGHVCSYESRPAAEKTGAHMLTSHPLELRNCPVSCRAR